MDDRLCFIAACLREEEAMSALCARFGISRKTGYKWLGRYEADGAAGLRDQSRARRSQTLSIDPETAATILALREKRTSWGPRKLLGRLALDHPDRSWPAASTAVAPAGRSTACHTTGRDSTEQHEQTKNSVTHVPA